MGRFLVFLVFGLMMSSDVMSAGNPALRHNLKSGISALARCPSPNHPIAIGSGTYHSIDQLLEIDQGPHSSLLTTALRLRSGTYYSSRSSSGVERPVFEAGSSPLLGSARSSVTEIRTSSGAEMTTFGADTIPNRISNNIVYLDFETVLQLGGANNLTIKEYQARHALALADAEQAKEWWLPTIYAGGEINQLWGSAMNGDGRFFTDVNRQNFWGGIGANMSWDFGEGLHTQKAASLRAEAAQYASDTERELALREVVKTYYDFLVAQLSYQSYEALTDQANSIAEQVALQVEVGILYESEKLLAQSNANHLKIEALNARLDFEALSAKLVQLLNLDPTAQVIAVDQALVPLESSNQNEWQLPLDSVYALRPEFKRDELTLRSLVEQKKTTTSGLLLPELSLSGYTSAFGDVFSPLYPTSAINASLIWEIPLGRIAYRGKLQQYDAMIALQENSLLQTKAAITQEVQQYSAQLATYTEQMEIAEEGSRLARLALEQSIERQRLGTAKAFEVLQAQEVFIKLRLDYLRAVGGVNYCGFFLRSPIP